MKTALIIDDDSDTLDIIRLILKEQGFETVTSLIALPLDRIKEIGPDVILLDEWLKFSNGSALCKKIKADEVLKHIPVFLISAVSKLDFIAQKCCADGFVEKPFNLTDIEDLVKSLVFY